VNDNNHRRVDGLAEPTTIVIITFATVVAATWAGGALAALLSSGSARNVTVNAAGQALVRLPRALSDPRRAWPEAAAASLPGPVLYWACQLAVIVVFAVAGYLVWRVLNRQRERAGSARSLGIHGDAGFAKPRDLARLRVSEPTPGRLTVGRCGPRLIACEPQASLAVVGPTGSGKTAGFAIPALLEWEGPVLATSVKADLLEATIKHRRTRGRVWVYDPTGSSGHDSARWSPLPVCETWAGATEMAAWMTEAAQARLDSVTDGDYWYTQARKALAPYLYAAALAKTDVAGLVRWVDTQNQTEVHAALRGHIERSRGDSRWATMRQAAFQTAKARMLRELDPRPLWIDRPLEKWPAKFLAELDATVNAEWQAHVNTDAGARDLLAPLVAAQALWGKEQRLRGSVFATVENVLAGWADPGVARLAQGCDIDLAEWLAGDNTIYIVAAAHEQARLRPVLTVLAQQAIRAAYDTANANHGTLERACLLLLDEAGNTAPLRDLPGYASTARSHGITLVTVWQDLAQIKATYRDRAQTVLNNHRAKLFGTGIADDATLEYVSRLVGDEQRTETNTSADLRGERRTVSEHHSYRRAAPIDVLRRIEPDTSVLLYGSELPALIHLRPWFEDATLRATADRPDLIRDNTGRVRARLRR
jgi:type IV secretion system protein VirD4